MKRWRDEPLLHFAVLGLCIFGVYKLVAPRPRDRIVLTPAFIAGLRDEARARTGHPPSPAELDALLVRFLDEEMLYREALTLGLDRGDVIVRRRLVQKMELLSRREPAEPDAAELARYLEQHRDRYDLPLRLSLRHVFVSAVEKAPAAAQGAAAEKPLADAEKALAGGADWEKLGLPFLMGRRFTLKSERELASLFGDQAARLALTLPEGKWSPLRSRYGTHLVYIDERAPAHAAEIDARLRNDWLEERRAHPDPQALAALRAHYTVERP